MTMFLHRYVDPEVIRIQSRDECKKPTVTMICWIAFGSKT